MMAKSKHNHVGIEYQPVTVDEIVDAIGDGGKTTEEIGNELWPHLTGGPSRGGPSRAAVAAAFQLAKLERAGAPICSEKNRAAPRRWFLRTN
jgi:hypothetical protein